MATVHRKPHPRQPAGNSRSTAVDRSRRARTSSARTTRSRDPMERQYQRGLKGQAFDAPFDPDDEAAAREAWEAGREQRKEHARKSGKGAKRRATRQRVRARAKTSKGYYRRATKNLRNPVRQQLTSGSQVFVLSLAVVALYVALQAPEAVGGLVGGLSAAVKWLADPTASIPHKPN